MKRFIRAAAFWLLQILLLALFTYTVVYVLPRL